MINYGNQCMGCGGCVAVCPCNAVELRMNTNGFYYAHVNESLCINCNLCERICPIEKQDVSIPLRAYSYQSKNKKALKECASGGFAFDVASQLLNEGYPICGVHYDKNIQKPVHSVILEQNELEKTRNSIYLQSFTADGFRKILQYERGVVIGAPCQISTIHNILKTKKRRNDFILIDFFCHGVPSYNLWSKYLDNYQTDMEKPIVQFRSKKYGWGNYTLRLRNEKTNKYVDYFKDKDIFYKVFLESMALNESCYNCPYYGAHSVADIRMGDFWGEKYQNDTKGVSAILTYTEEGEKIIEKIVNRGNVKVENIEEILKAQRSEEIKVPSCRKDLLKALSSKKSLKQINNTIIFRYKCVRRLKNIFRKG